MIAGWAANILIGIVTVVAILGVAAFLWGGLVDDERPFHDDTWEDRG